MLIVSWLLHRYHQSEGSVLTCDGLDGVGTSRIKKGIKKAGISQLTRS